MNLARDLAFRARAGCGWPGLAVLALSSAMAGQDSAQAPAAKQEPAGDSNPIAIVPFDSRNPDAAAKVTGSMSVSEGKALIASSGEVTSGARTTEVLLPRRGTLRVCAATTVKLAADSTVPAGETPGLMMAMDHGAVEASFATGSNADILLTPDFRILIGGPGAVEVKVRLGERGDTCVDNPGADAPYVLVTSVFDGGAYRVQPGQRVMFQHGSLLEVVDNEKEPCGCPPAQPAQGNEFPLAQSEGLAPLSKVMPGAGPTVGLQQAQAAPPLVYNAGSNAPQTAAEPQPPAPAALSPTPPAPKPGLMHRIGKFFRRIFGAE